MDAKNFGKNLAEQRKKKGLTFEQFSRETGLTPSALCQFESGRRQPNLGSIIKILRVIKIKFETMVTKKGA